MKTCLRLGILLGLVLLVAGCKARNGPVVEALLLAEQRRELLVPFSQNELAMTEQEAYDNQYRYIRARTQDKQDTLAGYKIAYASETARVRANLKEPIYAQLTDSMRVPDGGTVIQEGYRRFAAEAEIAVVMGKTIDKPMTSLDDLLPYIASVHAALDLPDYPFSPESPFTATDMIAANAGSYRFVLGPGRDPLRLNPDDSTVVLNIGLRRFSSGEATEAMGGPYYAILWLQSQLEERGQTLREGMVVLTGAPARTFIQPGPGTDISGTYTADAGALGTASVLVR